MKKLNLSIITVILALSAYTMLFHTNRANLLYCLFLASPLLIAWMVFKALSDKKYPYKNLPVNEQWEYRERSRDIIGTF